VPEHKRPHFERLVGTRIVAQPQALDNLALAPGTIGLRFAPDELFVTTRLGAAQAEAVLSQDPHAIVIDEGAYSSSSLHENQALVLLQHLAEWEMPSQRPAFVQGAVAGIATKLWFDQEQVLFIVQTPYAHELEERLA